MFNLNITLMKKILTFLFSIAMASSVFGQMEYLVDFELAEDTTYWETFANGPGGTKVNTISIVPNPAPDAVNGYGNVLKFHVKPGCENWVGMYADQDAPGSHSTPAEFAFTDFTGEKTLAYMVYKERNTEVGLKLERSINDGEVINIYMPTEKTFEWELVTFEYGDQVNNKYYRRLTVFVDHYPEGETRPENDSTDVYVDNIGVPGSYVSTRKQFEDCEMMLYPTPAEHLMAVKYADGLTGITLTDVMGRQVRTMNFGLTDNKVINVSELATGIYFLTAETVNGKVTMRFLKK
jgi:hypothetical protein